jgi:hypothetical protein
MPIAEMEIREQHTHPPELAAIGMPSHFASLNCDTAESPSLIDDIIIVVTSIPASEGILNYILSHRRSACLGILRGEAEVNPAKHTRVRNLVKGRAEA